MRIRIRKWNFISILRLVAGATGTVQGFIMGEFALSLAGFFLVYMAVAGVGDAGANGCEIEMKEAKEPSKKTAHAKVDAQL